ncbi:thioesterase domain-containing protein [Shewanella submarina]|uniref:YiiD C-terminal domain-containing protein n=1 Tax=Shewanella submarina TaxID=2016376 RepID=A0ABV7GF24_9GAMM|nr:YiiD C-terminal domain-containing protein [Shewanella submarina]MCL1038982.1 thioesterase domain-containing protein [Shewanella submarina]
MDVQPLLQRLQQTWHNTIPVSRFMEIVPLSADDGELKVAAALPSNLNLHQTMFAGSIYTLCTLTGWGAVWLAQELAGVQGDIVLGSADIRYLAPVTKEPVACVTYSAIEPDCLALGTKLKQTLRVTLWSDGRECAIFEGTFFSIPCG